MRLEQYIINEAKAADMELALVQAWKGEKVTVEDFAYSAQKIIDGLRKLGMFKGVKQSDAKWLGKASLSITETWKKYGGVDKTPKTDLKIGSAKISLKKKGKSTNIMSGGKGESRATFFGVLENEGIQLDEYTEKIEKYFNSFVKKRTSMNITDIRKQGSVDLKDEIKEADKMHKDFTLFLSKYLKDNDLFTSFIREATTGNIKFGEKSDGSAKYILVFDEDGNYKIKNIYNDEYIKSLIPKSNIRVSWKSTRNKGVYNIFTSVRLLQDTLIDEMAKYEGKILTEGIVKDVWTKIKIKVQMLWKKIKKWLHENIENIFIFFGIEPVLEIDSVTF